MDGIDTIGDLVELLNKYPPDMRVNIWIQGEGVRCIGEVYFEEPYENSDGDTNPAVVSIRTNEYRRWDPRGK